MLARWTFVLAVLLCVSLSVEARAQSPELIDALRKASEANNQGDLMRASSYYEKVLELTRREFGPDDTNTAIIENNLASLYLTQQRYKEAEALLLHSREHLERFFGVNSSNVAIAANNLGGVYAKTGRFEQATAQYTQAVTIWEGLGGPDHPNVREMRRRLADLEDRAVEQKVAEAGLRTGLGNLGSQPAATGARPGIVGERQAAAVGASLDDGLVDKLVSGAPVESKTPAPVAAAPKPAAAPPAATPLAKAAPGPAVETQTAALRVEPASTGKPGGGEAARWRVQVASLKEEGRAEAEWKRLRKLYAPALDRMEFVVERTDLGPEKGVYHRVYAGPLTRSQADALCQDLQKKNVWCQPRRF